MNAASTTIRDPDFASLREHEAARLFPIMDDESIRGLANDIKVNGLRNAVSLIREGGELAVLDGRNRILACRLLGITPRYSVWDGVDAVAFVVSENLHRRHLDESQRAMVAGRLANLGPGRPGIVDASTITQGEAARRLNVCRDNVVKARAVLKTGAPDVVTAVDRGELSMAAAAKIARLPLGEQATAMADALAPKEHPRTTNAKRRDVAVARLHDAGMGTKEIARTLDMPSTTVSKAKGRLGVAAGAPSIRLWRDIDHVATAMSGASTRIAQLADELRETDVKASEEDIASCIKRLSEATGSIRRLTANLRAIQRPR